MGQYHLLLYAAQVELTFPTAFERLHVGFYRSKITSWMAAQEEDYRCGIPFFRCLLGGVQLKARAMPTASGMVTVKMRVHKLLSTFGFSPACGPASVC